MTVSDMEMKCDKIKAQFEKSRSVINKPGVQRLPASDVVPYFKATLDLSEFLLSQFVLLWEHHVQALSEIENLKSNNQKED